MALKRTVGNITIERSGNGLETQWALEGPGGRTEFSATPDGTLHLTEAGLTQVGATDREAVYEGVWNFTPAEVERLAVDGNNVRTR